MKPRGILQDSLVQPFFYKPSPRPHVSPFKRSALLLLPFALPYAGLAQESDTTGGIPTGAATQPEMPVEEGTGTTILVVGTRPDDDSHACGTLSVLGIPEDHYINLGYTDGIGQRHGGY